MRALVSVILVVVLLLGAGLTPAAAQAKPEGEMRWALYVTLAPAWFDPAEVVGVLTPFWVLTAMHDALVKPMPGNHQTPSLAESWKVSPDGLVYEFKLREGAEVPQRRPVHRRGRAVELPSRQGREGPPGEGARRRDRRAPTGCASISTSRGRTS